MRYCAFILLGAEIIVTELQLKHGEESLGILRAYDNDFPWVNCKFEPTASFKTFEPLFQAELKLEDAYDRIDELGLQLVDVERGKVISEFILHIENNEAWFRF